MSRPAYIAKGKPINMVDAATGSPYGLPTPQIATLLDGSSFKSTQADGRSIQFARDAEFGDASFARSKPLAICFLGR